MKGKGLGGGQKNQDFGLGYMKFKKFNRNVSDGVKYIDVLNVKLES